MVDRAGEERGARPSRIEESMTVSLKSLIEEWEGIGVVMRYDRPTGTVWLNVVGTSSMRQGSVSAISVA